MAVKHNENMIIEKEDLNIGLQAILLNATVWNKEVYKCTELRNYKEAERHARVRDAYINSYWEITGVFIDYGDLEKE